MKHFQTPLCQVNEMILSNASIVLEEEVITGSIWIKDGQIEDIGQGTNVPKGAIDCRGDFICPGLVELHTDNLERHLQPRPGVKWPLKAAVISHDAELASVGITTVYDALRVGSISFGNKQAYDKYARNVADHIIGMQATGQMRISHYLHLRAEICSETVLEELAEFGPEDRVGIVSLMDHTPGQRQFRDISKFEEYLSGKYGMSKEEMQAHFNHLYQLRDKYSLKHEEGAANMGAGLGAILASHDDTTEIDVMVSQQKGVCVAEFPTTFEAAQACHDSGIQVMMGAPNYLRGGSHSGNIAAHDLVEVGVLDILSSDYAPSSLLMAAVRLGLETDNMAQGLHTVTSAPAKATGLGDRGEIAQGMRADIIRFSIQDSLPRIKGVWSQGNQIG